MTPDHAIPIVAAVVLGVLYAGVLGIDPEPPPAGWEACLLGETSTAVVGPCAADGCPWRVVDLDGAIITGGTAPTASEARERAEGAISHAL